MMIITITTDDNRNKYYRSRELEQPTSTGPKETLIWMEETYPLHRMNRARLVALLTRIDRWHAEARENFQAGKLTPTVWAICDDVATKARCKVEMVLARIKPAGGSKKPKRLAA
jgi:hypothetical protein